MHLKWPFLSFSSKRFQLPHPDLLVASIPPCLSISFVRCCNPFISCRESATISPYLTWNLRTLDFGEVNFNLVLVVYQNKLISLSWFSENYIFNPCIFKSIYRSIFLAHFVFFFFFWRNRKVIIWKHWWEKKIFCFLNKILLN
jgi:hypothetical protein